MAPATPERKPRCPNYTADADDCWFTKMDQACNRISDSFAPSDYKCEMWNRYNCPHYYEILKARTAKAEQEPKPKRTIRGRTHLGIVILVAIGLSVVGWISHPELVVGNNNYELLMSFTNGIFLTMLIICLVGAWILDFIFQ